MKKKSDPKGISFLDKLMEANTDVKNAWKKIILELEEQKKRAEDDND